MKLEDIVFLAVAIGCLVLVVILVVMNPGKGNPGGGKGGEA